MENIYQSIWNNDLYQNDIRKVADLDLGWQKLQNKKILITGATGLIGSFLIDVLMLKNEHDNLNCKVIAISRSEKTINNRFPYYRNNKQFTSLISDVANLTENTDLGQIDYLLHLASNTHPVQYANNPIETIMTNVDGLNNLLKSAIENKVSRVLFTSSNEIYGQNRNDVELFDENYCGYIDCNTIRAGYPESKRCCEALCQAYISEKNMNIVIARLTRTFGPTMKLDDSKASSQFIMKALANEDIVLKSEGNQYFSYTYVADAVSGLLTILLKGENGSVYNIADESCDIRLKDLASTTASLVGKKVIFELPNDIELKGFSTATKARLNGQKLKTLGWTPLYDINEGLAHTINILSSIK